jgi:hypothetical protein
VAVAEGLGDAVWDWLDVAVMEELPVNVVSTRLRGQVSTSHTYPRMLDAMTDVSSRMIVDTFILIVLSLRSKTFFRFQYKCPLMLLMRLRLPDLKNCRRHSLNRLITT